MIIKPSQQEYNCRQNMKSTSIYIIINHSHACQNTYRRPKKKPIFDVIFLYVCQKKFLYFPVTFSTLLFVEELNEVTDLLLTLIGSRMKQCLSLFFLHTLRTVFIPILQVVFVMQVEKHRKMNTRIL